MAGAREPFPTEADAFHQDDRVSFDKVTQTYKLEDETGEEWEWLAKPAKWVPVTDQSQLDEQQKAYMVEGVDENESALDQRKRKAASGDEDHVSGNGATKKQKAEVPSQPKRNTAVYVTSLPEDVDEEEIHHVFSKFGVIAESAETDKPRIKLYYDEDGNFKGDALIVYFRPESVDLAIDMLDETDFRIGKSVVTGPMRVREADASFKSQKEHQPNDEAKTKGTKSYRDRQKAIEKKQEMNSRLADWDDDDPATVPETSSRWDKVVILKHMFTLKSLEENPAEMVEIKEDVLEECEKIGKVTNVVLYDKEEDGVVTVRFDNAIAAKASISVFDGRWFDGRRVEAYIADGRERFKKTKKQDNEKDEEQRLDGYGEFIEGGDGDES